MAKYLYKCKNCNKETKKYASIDVITIACDCGQLMDRQLPTINKPSITEVIDSYMGIALPVDNEDIIKERKLDYFWQQEVPRLCNQYSPAHCLQNGWAYINEKGEYCIHTKQPSKR